MRLKCGVKVQKPNWSLSQLTQSGNHWSMLTGYEDDPLAGCIRYPTEAESERLMGLPADWTKYGADGAEIRSSSRYMALGNSIYWDKAIMLMMGTKMA